MPQTRRPTSSRAVASAAAVVASVALPCSIALGHAAAATGAGDPETTLSPYFYIPGGDPSRDELPLRGTEVDIDISGVIADVEVVQTYKNEGDRPISARYVFPASTRAAVHGLEMTIGERVINAVAKEREEARREFEQAERDGKSASLLEQQRPNVFTMNVANIMPGDEIEVALSYTELLVPTDGIYELVFPTVVGPRYSEKSQRTGSAWDRFAQTPVRGEGEPPDYEFGLRATLSTPIPLVDVSSPSHVISTQRRGSSRTRVELAPSEAGGGDRDFILRYQLAGKAVSSGLLLHEGERENFFKLMVEPPARVEADAMPPREYVFVVDDSGSMSGFPIDTARELVRELTDHLRPIDTFNVILFDGGAEVMAPRSVPATGDNVRRALEMLRRARGSGGTRLGAALKQAMALPHTEGLSRTFVVVTDGLIVTEADVFEQIRDNLGEANVFTFGIGSSVNRHLIEGLARAGMGESFVVSDPIEAKDAADRFIEYIRSPVLTDVRVEFSDFGAYDVSPTSIPDVMAERPIVIQGKWMGDREGAITLRGVSGQGAFSQRFDVAAAPVTGDSRGLAYLWARSRIAELSDFESAAGKRGAKQEITDLGLAYNLLTEHTSFIAVYDLVRNADGKPPRVDQPLPLPEGVPATAVGGLREASEPALAILSLAALFALALAVARRRARAPRARAAT